MPVTFAHPAAVLPLLRTPIPFAALSIGAMIPDTPLFMPWIPITYDATHTLTGILTFDLIAASALWYAWWNLIRHPLLDAAPAPLRRRITLTQQRPPLPLVALGAAIGAATHVIWDEFTHAGRWGATTIPLLATTHAGLPGYKWAQYISGIGGLTALAITAVVLTLRAPASPATPRRHPRTALLVLTLPLLAAATATTLTALPVLAAGGELRDLLYGAITRSALAATIALIAASAAWHLAVKKNRHATTVP
ncbi:Uncharacterised protein [Dermatophilus congolensis]|uniref:DUF4184 family protein n=1 Tax=Dermatophilus congolensis TaxID=1863 RepID=A0AA46BNB3_9MICO|nr:DUF4184 family protein [Dermatophilus congolensis]STD09090.1 Uncharacterised protein [Dermatophilus congolensis]